MPFDIAVFDDEYRYKRHIHLDEVIRGVLFKKLVTPEEYPSLGLAQKDAEDITFPPKKIPALAADLDKLEDYLVNKAIMSDEVKTRCMEFVASMKEICEVALADKKNVEFIAGE